MDGEFHNLDRANTVFLLPLESKGTEFLNLLSRRIEARSPNTKAIVLAPLGFTLVCHPRISAPLLRDLIVQYFKNFKALGFTRFYCLSSSRSPMELTCIEEAAKKLCGRFFGKIILGSLASITLSKDEQLKNWRDPYHVSPEPSEALKKEWLDRLEPMILARTPQWGFRSWYSLMPHLSSYRVLFVMTLLCAVLIIIGIRIMLYGFQEVAAGVL